MRVVVVGGSAQVRGGAKAPAASLLVQFTVPVGVVFVPLSVSVTVAVQLAATPTARAPQLTAVEVVRLATVTVALPLLFWWRSAEHTSALLSGDDVVCRLLPDGRLPTPFVSFCFNDPATTEIYALSLHDALPISVPVGVVFVPLSVSVTVAVQLAATPTARAPQLTAVEVVRLATVTVALPLLFWWVRSPA